mmetsp:Transcript_147960/g.368733  ORF Transcript_147960/g.368733 Transcript_147960/m.368733 type:complete len:80 (+) Transcript_147960:1801-2040(+)
MLEVDVDVVDLVVLVVVSVEVVVEVMVLVSVIDVAVLVDVRFVDEVRVGVVVEDVEQMSHFVSHLEAHSHPGQNTFSHN